MTIRWGTWTEWAFVALYAACLQSACAQVPDGAYATANASCVSLAQSKAQAELCVRRVLETWCGDGGLWSASDGGVCNDH
ncbi:MAG TPA: hypothetical protein VGJ79_08890 [Candidatus Dormibacteraeota bacterium]|jgi:hypothetical protein